MANALGNGPERSEGPLHRGVRRLVDKEMKVDIVEEMRGFEIDHEPDGWPGVRMRQVSALCDEAERLRSEMRPEWDDAGEATTLAAAAEDADEWMALIERLHNSGLGPWKFSQPDSLEKLRGCRRALRRFLTPNA